MEVAALMEGNKGELAQKKAQADYNRQLARAAQMAPKNSTSKAIPSQYTYKPGPADNAAKRAIVHHSNSHYHMAASKQFNKGVRVKGVISRHSKQGARVQGAKAAANNMNNNAATLVKTTKTKKTKKKKKKKPT